MHSIYNSTAVRMASNYYHLSHISHAKANYQKEQILKTDELLNRRYSLIPQPQNSRSRNAHKTTQAFKITLPEPVDNNRRISLLDLREQFKKHQQKSKREKLPRTINR